MFLAERLKPKRFECSELILGTCLLHSFEVPTFLNCWGMLALVVWYKLIIVRLDFQTGSEFGPHVGNIGMGRNGFRFR